MARGDSGRIVIEVDPEVKRRLYSALALSGSTLKDWFLKVADDYMTFSHQPPLPGITQYPRAAESQHLLAAEDPTPYKAPAETKP